MTPRPLNIVFCSGDPNALQAEPTRRFWPVFVTPNAANLVPQFRVSIAHADGRRSERLATGGTSVQHSIDAMEQAGLGGVVRIAPAGWVTP